jgi:putative CocE/NonD family hydrolase
MKLILFTGLLVLVSMVSKAQPVDSTYMVNNYSKSIHSIQMRDGIELYTIVYTPNAPGNYPILMNRTCYNASRKDNYNVSTQPSPYLIRDLYILVFQDVRGRYMSGGTFDNMRPNIPGNKKEDIDESSDTFDSIDWMIKNLKKNNGKVGIFGISYPGFYAAAALPDAHPALKAVSPQAPVSDFFFDDFHHHGAYLQSYTPAFSVFGYQKTEKTKEDWYKEEMNRMWDVEVSDGYEFYLNLGPLSNTTKRFHHDNLFWKQVISHPNYDEFWQKRSILPHLKDVTPAVMTVGGWYDAEDLYGPLNIYKTIEKNNPEADNVIVMGPWTHGGWAKERGQQTVNHIYYGDSISTGYQKEIELLFFQKHLKGESEEKLPEAYMYDTGLKKWEKHHVWPPQKNYGHGIKFGKNGGLVIDEPYRSDLSWSYLSDPAHPVPYRSEIEGLTFTPRMFITDDQRHAAKRNDVLTFQTEALNGNFKMVGEIMAKLVVSMTGTDADFIVKIIDVYPEDHKEYEHNPENVTMKGYEQLVRHETFRGRFRNSYEKPEPFVPGKKTEVNVPLQDINHTFKKGHRIMIQIHSTWFPYIDRNPQKYVENIFEAKESDFIKSTITIHGESMIRIN